MSIIRGNIWCIKKYILNCRIRNGNLIILTMIEILLEQLSYEEAVREYENRKNTRLGTLVANRELPILYRAKEIIDDIESE